MPSEEPDHKKSGREGCPAASISRAESVPAAAKAGNRAAEAKAIPAMNEESPQFICATVKDVAGRIAAVSGETPKRIIVRRMVGSEEVSNFVSKIQRARAKNYSTSMPLD